MSNWRHLRAIALLPTMAFLAIPGAVVYMTESVEIGWGFQAPLGLVPSVLGGVLMVTGLGLAGWNVALFATAGEGTLAPYRSSATSPVRIANTVRCGRKARGAGSPCEIRSGHRAHITTAGGDREPGLFQLLNFGDAQR